jgi:hypothetical protein
VADKTVRLLMVYGPGLEYECVKGLAVDYANNNARQAGSVGVHVLFRLYVA